MKLRSTGVCIFFNRDCEGAGGISVQVADTKAKFQKHFATVNYHKCKLTMCTPQRENPNKPPTKIAGVKVLKCIMPKTRSAFLSDLSPMAQSSPRLSAPVRYLHSLVRRLLYSHLTPSTLSSPTAPSTPILTPSSHRSMGDSVWCYDQCMSAALSSRGTSRGGSPHLQEVVGGSAPVCQSTSFIK